MHASVNQDTAQLPHQGSTALHEPLAQFAHASMDLNMYLSATQDQGLITALAAGGSPWCVL
jgi:hypothetical protein